MRLVRKMAGGDYRPIGDYALIGDAHTAALVARDGSVDWCCWPHFDSPAVFCRLLDARRGGHFRVGPASRHETSREYADSTNVLRTTHAAAGGSVRVVDFMPIVVLNETHEGEDIASKRQLLRLVEGLGGLVEVEVEFRPTFDFARGETRVEPFGGGIAATGRRGETLLLAADFGLGGEVTERGFRARFTVREGERRWLTLSYNPDGGPDARRPVAAEAEEDLERTLRYWRDWSAACSYEGPYRDLVLRSALVLKLLTFEETGALVAAPTTSLPEEVGGVRNWDYRYSWLRDSSLIIYALQLLGFVAEAADYFRWIEGLRIPLEGAPQIMYTIHGGTHMPETALEHLQGYRGSRPVRVGNAAAAQKQLDIYGAVLDAAHLYFMRRREPVHAGLWPTLRLLADEAAARWREPDQGIWEVRGPEQHFLHSKLMCWVALDRALKLAPGAGGTAEVERWARAREEVRRAILSEGYDGGQGAFTQAFGSRELDAGALIIPLVGFLPATDARVRSTARAVRERLSSGGLVYRYLAPDGLPGGEGTFLLCSFWMVDNLALCGRTAEARALFERITSYANDLGLLSEEVDTRSGELLGNYPQGFTHLGLVCSALNIERAEARGAERHAETASERAEEIEDSRRG